MISRWVAPSGVAYEPGRRVQPGYHPAAGNDPGADCADGRRRFPAGVLRPGRPGDRTPSSTDPPGSSPTSTTARSRRSATSTRSSASTGEVLDLMGSWVSHFQRPPGAAHRARHERGGARRQPGGRGDRRARPQRRPAPAVRRTSRSTPRSAASRSTTSSARSRCSRTWRGWCGPAARSCARSPTAASRRRRSAAGCPSTDEQHCEIVAEYFRRAGGWGAVVAQRRTPEDHRGDPLFGGLGRPAD